MVSIVIATYNRKKLISRSLDSIFNQTYQDFEIIIVDDGSSDGTEDFLKEKYKDSRIKYYKMEKNSGATAARNFGLEKIAGDYFLVWDSDDILYINAIEKVLSVFEKYPDLAVVSAPARSLLNGKEINFPKMQEGVQRTEDIISRSLASNHKVKIAKTSLCGNVRYRSKNIDFLINVAMAEKGKWYCLTDYLGDIIMESDSNSLTTKRKKTNLRLASERSPYLEEYLIKYQGILKNKYPKKYAAFSYGAAIGFFVKKEKAKARYFIREAVKNDLNIKYFIFYLLNHLPFGIFIFKIAVIVKNNLLLNLKFKH